MTDNKLKDFYNQVYQGDKNQHFVKYRDGRKISLAHERALQWLKNESMKNSILDFGCGEGDFLGEISGHSNLRRVGVDYSQVALENARKKYPGLAFILGDESALVEQRQQYDVVTSFGTLEHMVHPERTFKLLTQCMTPAGVLIVSCPSFLNLRGIIWMTLVKLFQVPMSLSDRHFLSVADFRDFAAASHLQLFYTESVDQDLGQGKDFRRDMERRLNNALRDAKMSNQGVGDLLAWAERNLSDFASDALSGAETLYYFKAIQ